MTDYYVLAKTYPAHRKSPSPAKQLTTIPIPHISPFLLLLYTPPGGGGLVSWEGSVSAQVGCILPTAN